MSMKSSAKPCIATKFKCPSDGWLIFDSSREMKRCFFHSFNHMFIGDKKHFLSIALKFMLKYKSSADRTNAVFVRAFDA